MNLTTWIALIFSIILGALGQIFMKEGMKSAGAVPVDQGIPVLIMYFWKALTSYQLILAAVSYGVSFIVWLGVLSIADLSLVRPLMSAGYFITIAYGFWAGEDVSVTRIIGTILIVIGIIFVAKSS